ncbi:MAG: threonine/serine exporter family protein [Candidatus Azobacteroides sp.]|nr:threonine/serine exporter family protein [Candidatus Azobacteroides sp.]
MDHHSQEKTISAPEFADFILDIGVFLLSSGAHCGRVFSNINRFAERWNFSVNINPTISGLTVTVKDKKDVLNSVTRYKTAPAHAVHLRMLSEISKLSWDTQEESCSFEDVKSRFKEVKKIKNYNSMLVSVAVGISCACLCLLAGGNYLNGIIAFIASFTGSLVRFKILKLQFNLMISFVIAAFTTTMIAGLDMIYHIGSSPEATLATSVLYLIPGVPLINTTIDLIEGYLSSALARALFSGFILLCIAAGMTISILIMGIHYF